MKKGKVFTKSQIALALLVVALGAAVWLNTKYSSVSDVQDTVSKYLGGVQYVGNESQSSAVQTGAAAESGDYFTTAKAEREKAIKAAQEQIEETLKNENASDDDKKAAVELSASLAKRIEAQTNIENLLKAKGFEKALAVISDETVTVVVKSDGLLASETLQIQDIATEHSGIPLSGVKIITVK